MLIIAVAAERILFFSFLLVTSLLIINDNKTVHSFSPIPSRPFRTLTPPSSSSTTPSINTIPLTVVKMNDNNNNNNEKDNHQSFSCPSSPHPFSQLPGDPSLLLVTNMDLGDKKLEIMKGIRYV
jgi:hypothetical protein